MHVYRFQQTDEAVAEFFGTRDELKPRTHIVPKHIRDLAIIDEVDVAVDKAGVLALLNGKPVIKVIKSFGLSPRGALQEVEA